MVRWRKRHRQMDQSIVRYFLNCCSHVVCKNTNLHGASHIRQPSVYYRDQAQNAHKAGSAVCCLLCAHFGGLCFDIPSLFLRACVRTVQGLTYSSVISMSGASGPRHRATAFVPSDRLYVPLKPAISARPSSSVTTSHSVRHSPWISFSSAL